MDEVLECDGKRDVVCLVPHDALPAPSSKLSRLCSEQRHDHLNPLLLHPHPARLAHLEQGDKQIRRRVRARSACIQRSYAVHKSRPTAEHAAADRNQEVFVAALDTGNEPAELLAALDKGGVEPLADGRALHAVCVVDDERNRMLGADSGEQERVVWDAGSKAGCRGENAGDVVGADALNGGVDIFGMDTEAER